MLHAQSRPLLANIAGEVEIRGTGLCHSLNFGYGWKPALRIERRLARVFLYSPPVVIKAAR